MDTRKAVVLLALSALAALYGCGSASNSAAPPSNTTNTQDSGPSAFSVTIAPASAPAGSPDIPVQITGANFRCNRSQCHDAVVWSVGGQDISLTWSFVSETQLTLTIPAALLADPVTALVQVQQWHKADDVPYSTFSTHFTVTKSLSHGSSGMTSAGNMSAARSGHSATLLLNGKVLIAGGGNATAELFDFATATFAPTGSMSNARSEAVATLLADGKVLVAGGSDSEGTSLASAEVFDPKAGRFTSVGAMLSTRSGATATLLPSGKVLITGGVDRTNVILNTAELYDPISATFIFAAGQMLFPRWGHTGTLLADGRVLLTGGRVNFIPNINSATVEVFDPATSTFTSAGDMATGRNFHTATLLSDGRVLILGGNASLFSLSSGELYDPASGQFTPTGNLQMGREFHTATAVASGKVLVTGGVNWFSGQDAPESQILRSAELFDPVAGTSAVTGNLESERVGHSATLLKDGRVLIAGGHDSEKNLATAEMYK